jgi:ubiquitin
LKHYNPILKGIIMSITITNPANNGGPAPKPAPSTKPPNPADKLKDRERERLEKQMQQTKKKLKMLQPMTQPLRAMAGLILAQNPNDEPLNLYAQIRPILTKMGLQNITVPNKTELLVGKTDSKKNSSFCVLLRRQAAIDDTIIDRIKRVETNLDRIVWDAQGIKVYIWWPYAAPAVPGGMTAPVPS